MVSNEQLQQEELIEIQKDDKDRSKRKLILLLLFFLLMFFLYTLASLGDFGFLNQGPRIDIDPKYWDREATVDVIRDATSRSGIKNYQYCITNDKNTSGCEWKDLADKKLNLYQSGKYYVYYRAVSNNGTYSNPSNRVTALIDNINPVINNLNIYEITDKKISINLDLYDSLSGIDSITYQINTQEPVISTDSSFTFDNLLPDTKYYITIVVYDKVANKTTLTFPITTMEEGFDLRNQCFDDDVKLPKITIEPDNEWWSTYKIVTVDFGDNSCKHEISLDLGKTWKEYTGPILYTADGYITARSTNETTGKSIESTDDPRVKYIDPTVPKIGLDDVPSSFEYGEHYDLPSNVEFGRSEGTYECFVDGVKEGGTQLLKIGEHHIKCYAYGNNGLTTTVEKDIEVLYRTGQNISWDGWITLTLEYPPESTNRRWKLYDPGILVTPDMGQYYWQDYTGPITIRLEDVSKIRISYDINGQTVVANYGKTDLVVDIEPEFSSLYPDETTDVKIHYSGQCQQKIYRLNNGDWLNYTGKFNVGPNTVIEGKCIYTKQVTDSTGGTTEQVNTGYSALYIPKKNYYTPDGKDGIGDEELDLEITSVDNPVVHNKTTEVTINASSQFNFVQYKILSRANPTDTYEVGSLQDYTDPFDVFDDTIIYAYGHILVNGSYKTITRTYYVGTTPDPHDPSSTYVPMFNLLPLKIDVDDNPCQLGYTTKARLIYNAAITDRIQYRVNGGNWRDYTGEFTVSPNDVIEARAESNDDSYYSSYDMLTVKGDTPSYVDILGPPEIQFEVQPDRSVKVTIVPKFGASYICYSVSNYYGEQNDNAYGTCLFANEYIAPFYISQGQYVSAQYIRQTDGRTSRWTVRQAPIINYPPGPYEDRRQPQVWIVADPLNSAVYNVNKVKIEIPSWYANKVQYSLDGIHYFNYTGPFYVYENCKIWAYAENQWGKAYTTYSVTNIGNTPPPTKPIVSPNISINYYPTNAHLIPTIESVDVSITYDNDATEMWYRIGSSGEWQEYTGPFVVTENTIIYAYEKTPNGIADTSQAINFFAKGFMAPWIVSDPDNSIASTLDTITILYDDKAVTRHYQIDGGPMVEYTGPFDITKNCIITAIETDANGILEYSTYYVTNIPSGGTSTVTMDDEIYIIDLHYPPASFNRQYKNDDEGIWKPYTGSIAIMSTDKYVELYDPVDNTLMYKGRDYINDYYIFDGDITRFNGHFSLKYDTVKSNSPAIIPDSTEYYVAKVGIDIVYDPALITQEYRLEYGDGAMTGWMPYTGKFYLTENDVTVYARGKDSNSTYSTIAKKKIDNIGIEGRILITRDYQALTAYLVDFNPNREIDRYEFSIDGVHWTTSDENVYTFAGLNLNTNYTIFVKVVDIDGRVYNFKTNGRTKNFTKPTFTANPNTNDWAITKEITINYHDEYYDDISIDKYYTLDGGTTWLPYEGPFTINSNQTITAMAVQSGNPSAFIMSDPYQEKMIDSSAPIITSVSIKEESARLTIDASAIDSESGVKYYYYSIDGVNYYKTPSTQYSFTNLKMNQRYIIYVKAENYAGVISNPTIVQPQTKDIDKPIFTYLESIDDQGNVIESDWGWEKLVHIRVPYLDQDTIVSYSIDNGTTWNEIQLTKVTLNVPMVPDPEYIRETDATGVYTGNILIYSPDGYTKVEVGTTQYTDNNGYTWTVTNDGSGGVGFTYDGPGANSSSTRTYGDFDVKLDKENQTIFVKVISGTENVVTHSFTTHLIDRTEPTLNYDNLPRVLEMGDDNYTLFNTWWVDNTKSGGDYSCTVNGDPVDRNARTGILRTGYQKIVCTVRTGAGHSVDFAHTLPVYSSLKIDAESIIQGIRDAQGIPGNALDGGDFTLVIPDPDGSTHMYPIELYNYDSTTITSNTTFCDNVPDYKYCVIRYNGDLTINPGVTITTPTRKLGFVIYVEGKLTNNGTISATNIGAQHEPENVLLWKNDDTYYEYIPAISSGTPGNGVIRGGSAGTSNGTAGAAGFFRESGSGGGGSSRGTSTGYTKGGSGAYGTSFAGGAGGGSAVTSGASGTYSQSNILTGGNATQDGIGGAGVLTWINANYYAGGGAGAIGGANTRYTASNNVTSTTTDSRSAGSLIIYAHDYQNDGNVVSQGGVPTTYGTGANGGSSGGGSIDIFYENLINRGTTNVSGGAASGSPAGGAGGSGTVTYAKILSDYDILGTKNNPYQITNASELLEVTQHNNDYRDAYYELANDIDMGGQTINLSSTGFEFSGHFDGKGYTISNFKSSTGLFANVYRGQIHDLNINNATVTGTNNVGILAGTITGKTDIWNINITNSKLTGTSNVGGLVGYVNITNETNIVNINVSANITGTTNTGGAIGYFVNSSNNNISLDNIVVGAANFKPQSMITTPVGSSPNSSMVINGGSYTGGVIGRLTNSGMGASSLTYSSFDGKINATGQYTGGLVGYVDSTDKDGHVTFEMNYTNADVTSTSTYVGGYIGYANTSDVDADRITINRSYSAGSVAGTDYVGGFIGFANKVNALNTFTVSSVTGANNIGGYIGNVTNSDLDKSYTTGLITHSGITNYGAFAGYADKSSVVDSYFSTETNKVQRSALGINQRIQHLLKQGFYNNYSFGDIWGIDEDQTTAYLLGLPIPDMVYESNLTYTVLEGDGTQTSPYIIHNKQEFEEIANELTAYYIQANDIDINNTSLNVKTEPKAPFSGYYSGEGYKITNIVNNSTNTESGIFDYADSAIVENLEIHITQTGTTNTGALFGYAKNGIEVRDVTVEGTVTGTTNTGGLIGQYENNNNAQVLYEPQGTIENVTINANVTGTNNAGGLIGYLYMNQDKNSSNQVVVNQGDITIKNINIASDKTITANYYVGGIVAYIYDISDGDITIDGGVNEANVIGKTAWTTSQNVATGGIVGYVDNTSTGDILIENSKNKGPVTGTSNVGGIAGYLLGRSTGTNHIYRTYSSGNVTGSMTNTQHNIGGIVGRVYNNGSKYTNEVRECYSTGDISGYDNVGGLVGGNITSPQSNISSYIGGMFVEVHDSFSTSKVNGTTNVGSLMGYQNYAKVYEVYAIGENLSPNTANHALVPVYSNSTNQNAYFSSQTIGIVRTQYGTNLKIWKLEHERFVTGFDFTNIWTVEEGVTTPYLQHVDKPDSVNDVNIVYNRMNGEGTEDHPYEIWDIEDFDDVRNDVNGVYIFMDDVNGDDAPLVPLTLSHLGEYKTSSFTATAVPETITFNNNDTVIFRGKIYGNNKTLKNITLPDTGAFGGIFPVCENIYVDNLTLDNVIVNGTHNTGLICGYNYGNINLDNVDTNNSKVVTTGSSYAVGGLIGYQYTTDTANNFKLINNDSFNLKINGYESVGGLVGYIDNRNTDINIKNNDINYDITTTRVSGGLVGRTEIRSKNFYADSNRTSGAITGSGDYIGGNFGYVQSPVSQGKVYIENSSNDATIKGNLAGGIVGDLYSSSTTNFVLNNLTNNGSVTKYSNASHYGGIVGRIRNNNVGVFNINNSTNNGTIEGYNYTGGIVGYSDNESTGDIRYEGVGNTGSVTGYDYTGGLVGYNYNKVANAGQSMTMSYSQGDVTGNTFVGGIIGRGYGLNTNNITVTKSYSSGDVTGSTASTGYVGGLIGHVNYGKIENVYSLGNLTGNAGLTGYSNQTTITNAYAINPMNTNALGSLTGTISNTTTTDSYYVSEISKVIRATTGSNLKMWQAVKSEYYNNWDFTEVWSQDENETPYLQGLPKAAKAYDASEIEILDGDGSVENPYLIHNVDELYYVRYELSANYKIVEDIDISTLYTIGEDKVCFTGYLDGDNHILSNSSTPNGIFYCTKNAGIDNLTVKDFSYSNVSRTGGLIGYVYDDLTINNINLSGNFNSSSTSPATTKSYVGALAGTAENANIVAKHITYNGNINYGNDANNNIGGLIGGISNTSLDIDDVDITTAITTKSGTSVGGLIGSAITGSRVKVNDYNHNGTITADAGDKVGGLIGNADGCEISLTNATHEGAINASKNIGGVAGFATGDINVENYTQRGNITGNGTNVAGIAGTLNRNVDSTFNSNITDVTLEGNITGTTYVAGIYGNLVDSVPGAINITNLDLDSTLTGTSYVSGVIGKVVNSSLGNIELHDSDINAPIIATGDYIGDVFGYLETTNAAQIKIDNNLFDFYEISTNGSYVGSLMGYAKLGGNGIINIDNVKNKHNTTEIDGNTTYNQIIDVNVSGKDYVGGIIGYLGNTSTGYVYLSNIGVEADVTGTGNYVGGLVGKSEGTSTGGTVISNIYHIGDTTGNNYVGGFIGQMIQSGIGTNHIDFGYNSGNVKATTAYAGGLIGTMKGVDRSYTAITRCYNDGSVEAPNYAAGMAATMERAIITNAFNLASVVADDDLAGIAVDAAYSTITDVYTTGRVQSTGRHIGGFVASSTMSVAKDSYFSADTTLVNKTALGMNLSFEYLLTKDPAYREWDWAETWDIEYEETTAWLQGLPKPRGVNRGYNEYSIMEGSGTEEDPYVIMNQFDLSRINVKSDAYYILGADIPIAESFILYPQSNTGNIFTGTLDGQGHSINNLVIDTHLDDLGLFGIVEDATIKNLTFINPTYKNHMSTAENVGSVTGIARGNTIIENVTVSGAKFDTLGSNIGGIVGKVESGNVTINDIDITDIEVNGTNNIGGAVGLIENTDSSVINLTDIKSNALTKSTGNYIGGVVGKITNSQGGDVRLSKSYAIGEVTSEGDYVGGLVGYIDNSGTGAVKVEVNYADATVSGKSYVGGLIGGAIKATITNDYSLGSISGDTIGGFIADSRNNTINHAYSFTRIEGYNDLTKIGAFTSQDVVATYNDVYYTSDKMIYNNQPEIGTDLPNEDFVKQNSFANFDFTNVWKIDEGTSTPYFKDVKKPDFNENYIKADYTQSKEHWYDFFIEDTVSYDGYYKVEIKNQTGSESHYINMYVYNEDQTWADELVLGNKYDVATSAKEAANSVGFKVNGNLHITSTGSVTTFASTGGYGGPKGLLSYVSGTFTNDGVVSMTKRGAKAAGQNVYLYRMPNGFIETVPRVGALGSTGPNSPQSQNGGAFLSYSGNPGKNGTNRQTGGGGSGGLRAYNSTSLTAGRGGNGTSYSGGAGGGGLNQYHSGTVTGAAGSDAGGAGGAGTSGGYSSATTSAGGGAGNPGGKGALNGSGNVVGNDASTKGQDGTGGLYVLFCNTLINNNKFEANGALAGYNIVAGGSSGGGSVNILCEHVTDNGDFEALGGASVVASGPGGRGGNGYADYSEIDPTAPPQVDVPIITTDTPNWSFTKTVTIDYNSGWDRQYSLDNGQTWNTYTEPFIVDQSWTTVIARTVAHGVVLESSSYLITMIDEFVPIVKLEFQDSFDPTYESTSIAIPTYQEFNEAKSSGSTTCYYDNINNVITNVDQVPTGRHTITCDAVAGSGKTTTINKVVKILATNCDDLAGNVYNFSYTQTAQNFDPVCLGLYKFEVWGGKGGNDSHAGGNGGYSLGNREIVTDNIMDQYYILTGGAGGNGGCGKYGGFNGGGNDGPTCSSGAGGGLTQITVNTNRGILKNYANYKSEIMMVAGGGGGGGLNGAGGSGGGTKGGDGTGRGGTQTAGGAGGPAGSFGQGAHKSSGDGGGGGGGYYGGGAATSDTGGGGGSGYVNPSYLINTSMSNGVNGGNGYARITYIGYYADIPEITVDDPVNWTGSKEVTITYDDVRAENYKLSKEYSIDNGISWLTYTGPITLNEATTVIARTSHNGNTISSSSFKVTKIFNSKPEIYLDIDDHYKFEIDHVDIPTRYNFNHENDIGNFKCWYGDDSENNSILNIDEIPEGLWNITCEIVNGYNKRRTVTKENVAITTSYITNKGATQTFDYNQAIDVYKVTVPGYYKLEVWGAQGGTAGSTRGGYGGYATGEIYLDANKTLYIGVGGQGGSSTAGGVKAIAGGYNGGGYGYQAESSSLRSSGGGGATHIAIDNNLGVLKNYSSNRDNVILVAGGGAGGYGYSSSWWAGNNGGGYIGGYSSNSSSPGTQTAGYEFGQGGGRNSSSIERGTGANQAGGGGGWYGGHAWWGENGAGGGSGWINHSGLEKSYMTCYSCSTSNDPTTLTKSNTCTNSGAVADCSKQGNGSAKITKLAIPVPNITVNTTQYAFKKIVTIEFPNDSGFAHEYSLDNGDTWNTYTQPFEVNEIKTVIARLAYKGNTLTSSSYTINNIVHDCDEYASKNIEFRYKGYTEELELLCDGVYKIEAWGASGGNGKFASYDNIEHGGLGAYTSGIIEFNKTDKIYINVGQRGTDATAANQNKSIPGGYNGGGNGVSGGTDDQAASGGGASDIRLTNGAWDNATSLNSRIMVAAGGGGGHSYANTNNEARDLFPGINGQTTGYTGNIGVWNGGSRQSIVNQTAGASFGKGASHSSLTGTHGAGGGGGGYYGGTASTNGTGGPGAGGSSYISGHVGSVAITSETSTAPKSIDGVTCPNGTKDVLCSIHYSNKYFVDTKMIAGNNTMPTYDGTGTMTGNDGNGFVKVKYIGDITAISQIPEFTVEEDPSDNTRKLVTITYDSYEKEYSIDLGKTWNKYTQPLSIYGNATIIARTTYLGRVLKSSSFTITSYQFDYDYMVGKVYEYDYTGKGEEFIVPKTGAYRIELWGASGKYVNNTATPGLGGYTAGDINLRENEKLYVYVGESGNVTTSNYGSQSFNGGGYTHNHTNAYGRGGGATDVRLDVTSLTNWNDFNSLKSRIMVAAGGGSGHNTSNSHGGAAGGLVSYKGNGSASGGIQATQTSGYAFGSGGPGLSGKAYSGSGGGYFGGASATASPCDVSYGGSSFISGHNGSIALTSSATSSSLSFKDNSEHYSGKVFTNTQMYDGYGFKWTTEAESIASGMPATNGTDTEFGHLGNGYAKITYLGTPRYDADIPNISVTDQLTRNYRTVTIFYDSDNIFLNEYSTDNGRTWNEYHEPFKILKNMTIIARSSVDGIVISSSSFTVTKFASTCDSLVGTSYDFDYSGTQDDLSIICDGTYKLEVWGAQGGSYNSTYFGGYGGYSVGTVDLTSSDTLYINVGGAGTGGSQGKKNGGYNGGGTANANGDGNIRQSSGGGATHIATVGGLLSTLSAYKDTGDTYSSTGYYTSNEILIVAAGGGGGAGNVRVTGVKGGAGGGATGNNGQTYVEGSYRLTGYGGKQTAGGSYAANSGVTGTGKFGEGATTTISGGGGGFFGGGVASYSGGGGAGYIGSSRLISSNNITKHMTCYNCAADENSEMKTETSSCVNGTPQSDCAKSGNGHARITYIYNPNPEVIDASQVTYTSEYTNCTDVECALNELYSMSNS